MLPRTLKTMLGIALLSEVVVGGWLHQAAGQKVTQGAAAETANGFVVHEWGVFNVFDDEKAALQIMTEEWKGLPKFVYGVLDGRTLPYRGPVRKPVVYFHSAKALTVQMKVDFPKGKAMVWWPATEMPNSEKKDTRSLHWGLYVKEGPTPAAGLRKPPAAPPEVPPDHWFNQLRAVNADEVFSLGHLNRLGGTWDREKFVYYDGFVPAPDCLEVSIMADKIAIKSRVTFPVYDMIVVDRRNREKVRVAGGDRIEAQGNVKELDFRLVDPKRWPADGTADLVARLQKAGLNADEGQALALTWEKDFFLGPQLTVIYRLPQEEYDRLLPLTLTPRPEKIVRVGLVQHIFCDQGLIERVQALVKELGVDAFARREKATKELLELKKVAFQELQRLCQEAKDPEVKKRLNRILSEPK